MNPGKGFTNPGKGFTNRGKGFTNQGRGFTNQGRGFRVKASFPEWGEDGSGAESAIKPRAQPRRRDPDRVRATPAPSDPGKFRTPAAVETGFPVSLPKSQERRNPAVMDAARGRSCNLHAPYTEFHDPQTTVSCHGNWGSLGMGKALGRKSDDCYVVFGCYACHNWLDSDASASKEDKQQVFLLGMYRQMLTWEQMAVSTTEPERFRRAARWALQCLEDDEFDPRIALNDLLMQSQRVDDTAYFSQASDGALLSEKPLGAAV